MRATSRRMGSNPEITTASGVSSIIRSTPVIVSRVLIFLPSRPMILPFISSLGSWTTEIVVSETWSAAQRWIALTTISFAFLSASSLASASMVLIMTADSCFTSSSTIFKRYSLACSEVKPEIFSSSCTLCSLSLVTSSFFLFKASSLAFKLCSFLSIASDRFSTFSSFCWIRLSVRWTSFLLSRTSFSSSLRVLSASSFTSRSFSRFVSSAVLSASSIIFLALSSALPIFSSVTFFWYADETIQVKIAERTRVTAATITVVITGAPPYSIFIVQYFV